MDPVIENGFPPEVRAVREKIEQAHAVIFASPEHNTKVSAALKNAYDWISFTHNLEIAPPIRGKPAALIVSSLSGGIKTQEHFRRICEYCKVKLMGRSLLVKKNEKDFDSNGNVVSQEVMHQVE